MKKIYSTNDEDFNHDFDSAADNAISEVIYNKVFKPGIIVSIYEADFDQPTASDYVPDITDMMGEYAYDNIGEATDMWPNSTKEQNDELQSAIKLLVDGWASKHGLQPIFGLCKNSREIKLRVIDSDGNYEIVQQGAESDE